jgi:hypothetical protein
MVLTSLKSGIASTLKNKRMVFVYYLMNLIFGLIIMLPMYFLLNRIAGNTLMMEKMAGRLDIDFFFELLIKQSSTLFSLRGLFLFVPMVYWLFGLFLSGGAYAIFISDVKYSPSVFWSGSAKYFGRFFRLFLWSIPVFAVFYCIQFIEIGVERLIYGSDPYQNIIWWGTWIRVGIGYIGILIYYLVLDYTRIDVVINDETKMRRALWYGIKFTFRNFFKTFNLTLILFLIGIAALVIYNPIVNSLHAPSGFIIFTLFIVQQIYMFVRMILKLTLYSSQVSLYNSLTPEEDIAELTIENA